MTPRELTAFLTHVDTSDPTGCWPWTASLTRNGYGKTRRCVAHKAWWEHLHGPVPPGLVLDHTCHDPAVCTGGDTCPHRRCVRPDHLAPTTQGDNVRRGVPATKTECKYGHSRWGRNGSGRRYCLDCHAARQRARTQRR